ncbi:MAG: phosphatidylserine decarboxylase [Deltaproteobacteria bacterium]
MSSSGNLHTRIYNTLPVAKEGLPFIFFGLALVLLLLYFRSFILTLLALLCTLFTVYFFRDPKRDSDAGDRAVLVPADGKVLAIDSVEEQDSPLGVPSVKASVFMSLFDVHVNRIPASGRISDITYHPGKFFAANRDKASEHNERNRITLETSDGQRIVFVQIAGIIIYLPANSRILARPGHRVKGGQTILGYLS